MTMGHLSKIWEDFGISEQTTNLIVAKIKSLNYREKPEINRIVFTIQLLIWICNDENVAQSLASDIAPRTIDEFITSFFRETQNNERTKLAVLKSILIPMVARHTDLRKREALLSAEEKDELGDTYNGLEGDLHQLYGSRNNLSYTIMNQEGINTSTLDMTEQTIELIDLSKLPLKLKKI